MFVISSPDENTPADTFSSKVGEPLNEKFMPEETFEEVLIVETPGGQNKSQNNSFDDIQIADNNSIEESKSQGRDKVDSSDSSSDSDTKSEVSDYEQYLDQIENADDVLADDAVAEGEK